MKIALLADNYVGLKAVEYLVSQREELVGLFLHPPEHQHLAQEIAYASKLPADRIFTVGRFWSDSLVSTLKTLNPDIILVILWHYLLPRKVFGIPKLGSVNFHMSYLPYNRGKKPNVWPFIDGSPAGVSLHYIDDGIDSGKLVARRRVEVDLVDTAKTLYERLLTELPLLFEATWPLLKKGENFNIQDNESGTFHLDKDFKKLDEINLLEKIYPLDLINHLRAKTFAGYPSAYFIRDGKKVYVRVQLDYGD